MTREIVFYIGSTGVIRWSRQNKLRHYHPTPASDKRLAELLTTLCGLGLAEIRPASPLNLGVRYIVYDIKPRCPATL